MFLYYFIIQARTCKTQLFFANKNLWWNTSRSWVQRINYRHFLLDQTHKFMQSTKRENDVGRGIISIWVLANSTHIHTLRDSHEMMISFLFFFFKLDCCGCCLLGRREHFIIWTSPLCRNTHTFLQEHTAPEIRGKISHFICRVSPTARYQHECYRRLIKQFSVWML